MLPNSIGNKFLSPKRQSNDKTRSTFVRDNYYRFVAKNYDFIWTNKFVSRVVIFKQIFSRFTRFKKAVL